MKNMGYLLLLSGLLFTACKKAHEQPITCILYPSLTGQWQYVRADGGYGVIENTTGQQITLTLNTDSTYTQFTASGKFMVKNTKSLVDSSIALAITFSTVNNFNAGSWDMPTL